MVRVWHFAVEQNSRKTLIFHTRKEIDEVELTFPNTEIFFTSDAANPISNVIYRTF